MSLSKLSLVRGKLLSQYGGMICGDCYWKIVGNKMIFHIQPQNWSVFCIRSISGGLIQRPATGRNMPGQGLKKYNAKEDKLIEENSAVLRFINKKIEEQKRGAVVFPLLPDYKFYWQLLFWSLVSFATFKMLWPDILEVSMKIKEEPTADPAVRSSAMQSPEIKLYKLLPLRFISRVWGRVNNVQLFQFLRKPILSLYVNTFDVNMDEALIKDLKLYRNLGEFFRRPIDMKFRPIDQKMNVVCPSDGVIMTIGEVQAGTVEQIKGVTYSLQQFLGPLFEEPSHDKWGRKENYEYDFSKAPPEIYQPALMKDPEKNALYYCVIYLGPGDYHRFHSPVQWKVKYRRHFPGNLLSVNPRVAALVKDLFVLNERVVLSGEWAHGFFSMAAVGATNVGCIKIYNDILLRTNRAVFKNGTYFDRHFGEDGSDKNKGELVGEFNLGSTIVLVFEAPKNAKFSFNVGQAVKVGQGLF